MGGRLGCLRGNCLEKSVHLPDSHTLLLNTRDRVAYTEKYNVVVPWSRWRRHTYGSVHPALQINSLLVDIFSYIDGATIVRLERVCLRFHEVIKKNEKRMRKIENRCVSVVLSCPHRSYDPYFVMYGPKFREDNKTQLEHQFEVTIVFGQPTGEPFCKGVFFTRQEKANTRGGTWNVVELQTRSRYTLPAIFQRIAKVFNVAKVQIFHADAYQIQAFVKAVPKVDVMNLKHCRILMDELEVMMNKYSVKELSVLEPRMQMADLFSTSVVEEIPAVIMQETSGPLKLDDDRLLELRNLKQLKVTESLVTLEGIRSIIDDWKKGHRVIERYSILIKRGKELNLEDVLTKLHDCCELCTEQRHIEFKDGGNCLTVRVHDRGGRWEVLLFPS